MTTVSPALIKPAVVKLAVVKPAVVNLCGSVDCFIGTSCVNGKCVTAYPQKAQNPWANVKCPFNQVCQNANCVPSFEMVSSYVMRYWYAYYLLFFYVSFIYWFFAYTTNNLF